MSSHHVLLKQIAAYGETIEHMFNRFVEEAGKKGSNYKVISDNELLYATPYGDVKVTYHDRTVTLDVESNVLSRLLQLTPNNHESVFVNIFANKWFEVLETAFDSRVAKTI